MAFVAFVVFVTICMVTRHNSTSEWGASACPAGKRGGKQGGNTGVLALLPVLPGAQRPGRDPYATNDPDALHDLLRRTENELAEERRKATWLQSAFLPPTIARQLAAGKTPDAGRYHSIAFH